MNGGILTLDAVDINDLFVFDRDIEIGPHENPRGRMKVLGKVVGCRLLHVQIKMGIEPEE